VRALGRARAQIFVPNTEARFEGKRIADTADCAAVRQAWK